MNKQMLRSKKTYSEQIEECTSWEQVLKLKNPDNDRPSYVIYADPSWIESFSNEEGLYSEAEEIDDEEDPISDYDLLLKEIRTILNEEEMSIYLFDAEEAGSLRWIAKKIGKSHEYTRSKLFSIKEKLRQNLSAKWRY